MIRIGKKHVIIVGSSHFVKKQLEAFDEFSYMPGQVKSVRQPRKLVDKACITFNPSEYLYRFVQGKA